MEKKARMSTIHIMGLMLPLKTRFLRHLIQFEGKQTGWEKQSLMQRPDLRTFLVNVIFYVIFAIIHTA